MKIMRIGEPGQERPAVLLDHNVAIDVSPHVSEIDGRFLATGGVAHLRSLLEATQDDSALDRVQLDEVRIGAPIARPHQVVCIGLNYADHADESGMPIPEEPVIFTKATNTVVGPNDDIELPRNGHKVDWEVELSVVIGKRCQYLDDRSAASAAIAGYTIANDVSERNFQLERGGQWYKGKSCATFNPLGPYLVTPDELDDPMNLELGLDLNGNSVQHGSTSTMVFNVPEIVRYVSQFLVLEPGDIINTGTPPGVGMGMHPQRFLREGDIVEPWVQGLGRQRSIVVEAR